MAFAGRSDFERVSFLRSLAGARSTALKQAVLPLACIRFRFSFRPCRRSAFTLARYDLTFSCANACIPPKKLRRFLEVRFLVSHLELHFMKFLNVFSQNVPNLSLTLNLDRHLPLSSTFIYGIRTPSNALRSVWESLLRSFQRYPMRDLFLSQTARKNTRTPFLKLVVVLFHFGSERRQIPSQRAEASQIKCR